MPLPPTLDLVVIGAGLAGLASAWFASKHGKRVRLVSKGWGALYWNSGCIDVLGYSAHQPGQPILEPGKALAELILRQPAHPYAIAGLDALSQALAELQALSVQSGYPLVSAGDNILDQNWLLPTVLGTLRPTCLAPATMVAGDCRPQAGKKTMILVGFQDYLDFFPGMAASNLVRQGIDARPVMLDLPQLKTRNFVTSRVLADLFENAAFRSLVVDRLQNLLEAGDYPSSGYVIAFPAVLGIDHASLVWQDLQNQLGCPVFEMPGLPPSIPGIRLHRMLTRSVEQQGGRVFDGMQVVESQVEGAAVKAVLSEAAARLKSHQAESFILATGGFLGGGLVAKSSGLVNEPVFNLHVDFPTSRGDWFHSQFLEAGGHPLYASGIPVDQHFRPQEADSTPVYTNLYAVGSILSGADSLRERSLEGIALVTAYAAANNLVGELKTGGYNHA